MAPQERPIKLDIKHLAVFAYQGIVVPLEHQIGKENYDLWLDPDATKLAWGKTRKQAKNARRVYFDVTQNWIESLPIQGKKPQLIELADILAYTAARAESRHHVANFEDMKHLYALFGAVAYTFQFDPGEWKGKSL